MPWASRQLDGLRTARLRWELSAGGALVEETARVFVPVYVAARGRRAVCLEAQTPTVTGHHRLLITVEGLTSAESAVEVVERLPRTTHGPQPRLGAKLSLTSGLASSTVDPGSRLRVSGTIENTGGVVWWSSRPARPDRGEVRIGYRWYRAGRAKQGTEPQPLQGRIEALGRDLGPGDSTAFSGIVNAPPEPGEYEVLIGPVAENVGWFGDLDPGGSPPFVVRVTVVGWPDSRRAA